MMTIHPEELVRDAIVNILSGNPQDESHSPVYPIEEVADRIFPNRPTPLGEEELPAICVYGKTTYMADPLGNTEKISCTLTGVIEIMLKDLVEVDRQIDRIAIKIWNLLAWNRYLVDPVLYTQYLTQFSGDKEKAKASAASCSKFTIYGDYTKELLADGAETIGSGKFPFEAIYELDFPFDTGDGVFDTLHNQWQLQEGNNAVPEAEDHITHIHQEE